MIPVQNIVAWGNVVLWADQRQVEQDVIIGRSLVEISSDDPRFLLDVRPLLPAAQAEALTEEAAADIFGRVFAILIGRLPGEPWERTQAMKERFGGSW